MSTVLEICQGPDCFGTGGGAVLLEIEDLVNTRCTTVKDNKTKSSFTIKADGCRNHCTMGPNVYVDGIHYTKVNSIEACRAVALDAGIIICHENKAENTTTSNQSSSVTLSLRQRQMERFRWQELRRKARVIKRKVARTTGEK